MAARPSKKVVRGHLNDHALIVGGLRMSVGIMLNGWQLFNNVHSMMALDRQSVFLLFSTD